MEKYASVFKQNFLLIINNKISTHYFCSLELSRLGLQNLRHRGFLSRVSGNDL